VLSIRRATPNDVKVRELLECALPLLAEGDHERYPYWFGGTCFAVRFNGRLYVVTAEHCVRDKDRNEVRVQRQPGSDTLVTLRALFIQDPSQRDAEDPDQHDWAVFQAVEPEDSGDSLVNVVDVAAVPDAPLPPPPGHKLLVRGYPKTRCLIDYEKLTIVWQAYGGTGQYVGATSSKWLHTMKMDDISQVESVDGLSGSPVFLAAPEQDGLAFSFAGMVLRGSKESGLLHFLDRAVVRAAIRGADMRRG
jgi:trypsin-like peptidase